MIEIPESINVAKQLNETVKGKVIKKVCANHTPHSFAWYYGDPNDYNALLAGKSIGNSSGIGSNIEINVDDCIILFGDGVNVRYLNSDKPVPNKHQMLIEFDDNTHIVCTIQMYGGLWAFKNGQYKNEYYLGAKEKPLPLGEEFNVSYFDSLRDDDGMKMSVKAFLATKQRIPGLGNGVLQDILYNARIHPKRKMITLSDIEYENLYVSIKETLNDMTIKGGRDTEKDLFGNNGGYITSLSKNTLGKPCKICGEEIKKSPYLGGTIYFCEHCQK